MNAPTATQDLHTVRDPLDWFTVSSGTYVGGATMLEPGDLPEPYRTLLVHEGSMTERLAHRFGEQMTLDIISAVAHGDRYARWILLSSAARRCLAMGGVCLDLRRISASARMAVLDGDEPLGRLLSRHGFAYDSVPHAFFSLSPAPHLRDLLQMEETRRVFGRRTVLRIRGQKLGDVVEVLPCYDVQTSRPAPTATPDVTWRPTW